MVKLCHGNEWPLAIEDEMRLHIERDNSVHGEGEHHLRAKGQVDKYEVRGTLTADGDDDDDDKLMLRKLDPVDDALTNSDAPKVEAVKGRPARR